MARFGDGLAVDADLIRAAEQATRQAVEPLAGRRPDLVCVFLSGREPEQAAAAAERVSQLSDAVHVLGCSAAGVIGASRGVEQASAVSVWAAVLPGTTLRTFHLEVLRAPDGLAVVGMPESRPADQVAILLADPYSFPADGFIERLNDTVPGLPVVGGLGMGLAGPGSTRLVVDGRVVDRGAIGAVLSGPLTAKAIVSQGCRPIGPTMAVTASEGNLLLGLAGQPALARLQQVLSELSPQDQALASRGLHVGIAMDEYADEHERGDFLIRGVVGVDAERQAVAVGDIVEVGRTVRFHVRDADAADADLHEVLTGFRADSPGEVEGALLFSCNGRGANLFASADHDVLALRSHLAVPVGGFFAAGEIGPVAGRNHLHGFTASILAFGAAGPG